MLHHAIMVLRRNAHVELCSLSSQSHWWVEVPLLTIPHEVRVRNIKWGGCALLNPELSLIYWFLSCAASSCFSCCYRWFGGVGYADWHVTMEIILKVVRPLKRQLENESQRLWENIMNNLVKRGFGEAMREKFGIEQRQRDEAAERKRCVEWIFCFLLFLSFCACLLVSLSWVSRWNWCCLCDTQVHPSIFGERHIKGICRAHSWGVESFKRRLRKSCWLHNKGCFVSFLLVPHHGYVSHH